MDGYPFPVSIRRPAGTVEDRSEFLPIPIHLYCYHDHSLFYDDLHPPETWYQYLKITGHSHALISKTYLTP